MHILSLGAGVQSSTLALMAAAETIAEMNTEDTPTKLEEERLLREIGPNLRAARKAEGWSQAKVSDAAGIHLDSLAHYERGTRYPSLPSLIRLCQAMCVPISQIIELTPPPEEL